MRSSILAVCLLLLAAFTPGCERAREALKAGADTARAAPPPPPPSPPPPGVTFAARAPVAGEKAEDQSRNEMAMEVSFALGKRALKMAMQTTETETRTEEVLAAAGGAVTKLRVTYTAKTNVMREGKKERKLKNPLAGNTYTVESKDGKLTVLDARARPVKGTALKLITSTYETLGKPDPMTAALPRTPLVTGQKVEALARAFQESMKGKTGKGMTIGDVTVTFRDREGDVGVFDVTAKLLLVEKPMKFEMDLKGQVSLRLADGQPAGLTLEGPVTASSADRRLKLEGTGTMKMSMTRKKV
jgi:hypothetical protein